MAIFRVFLANSCCSTRIHGVSWRVGARRRSRLRRASRSLREEPHSRRRCARLREEGRSRHHRRGHSAGRRYLAPHLLPLLLEQGRHARRAAPDDDGAAVREAPRRVRDSGIAAAEARAHGRYVADVRLSERRTDPRSSWRGPASRFAACCQARRDARGDGLALPRTRSRDARHLHRSLLDRGTARRSGRHRSQADRERATLSGQGAHLPPLPLATEPLGQSQQPLENDR
jgi:hypothetical protein